MSNVTAALECPGCEEILEAEERPNINWKLGTTRIVLVPTATAIAHVYECTDLHDRFSAVLAAIGITDLDEWQKRLLIAPSISVAATIASPRPEGIDALIAANPSVGASLDTAVFDEFSIEGADLAEVAAIAETTPGSNATVTRDEATGLQEVNDDSTPAAEPEKKPAPRKRTTK
ncbi:hypothetical protein ACSYDW_01285 [Paeniglutamicibacter sp. R2-26]|uniref:hypothetical protein n=1 Tax=Paeniglutamicibacter sp. R2-26 TaxID=3144417 RepID=UPI003EE7B2FE